MFEFQIVVSHGGSVVFKTEWHVGLEEARGVAWLLAQKLGGDYDISVRERKEPFVGIPWEQFGMTLAQH